MSSATDTSNAAASLPTLIRPTFPLHRSNIILKDELRLRPLTSSRTSDVAGDTANVKRSTMACVSGGRS